MASRRTTFNFGWGYRRPGDGRSLPANMILALENATNDLRARLYRVGTDGSY